MEIRNEIHITVNGKAYHVEVDSDKTLVEFLREDLGLLGTRTSCEVGECGTCTVLIDGKAYNSCILQVTELDGRSVTTIEGLAKGEELDPVQSAFIEADAVQCGYCTPGMIMSAKGLLNENPSPDDEEIRHALAGNFCRCTGYKSIIKAVRKAADR
ncbi:MAG TPA: (2Fe-2S)-binding protein [Bacillota bacterium]|nr:(2Fe-2S)-binding protein [Bacillota bacterium]